MGSVLVADVPHHDRLVIGAERPLDRELAGVEEFVQPLDEGVRTLEALGAEAVGFPLDIREYDAELHEGDRHAGLSALVDLVGRK